VISPKQINAVLNYSPSRRSYPYIFDEIRERQFAPYLTQTNKLLINWRYVFFN